jgi:hypothetical protein
VTFTSSPLLALAPGHSPGTGATTGLSCDQSPSRRLDRAASALDRAREGWLVYQTTEIRPATAADPGHYESVVFPASDIRSGAYDTWLSHVWAASACSRPVKLTGKVSYADRHTGEISGTIHTNDLPDQVIYKPCGNRRATTCPGCAEVYRRDSFHLIRAGLAGGKGIPETVSGHPLVFATFTAPSFGAVHTRSVRLHTCAGKQHCRCKAEPCHPRRDAGTCPHGRPRTCYRRHFPGDEHLGEPLCMDCYDYPAHVVWNAAAGELWRRTKQDIERHLIQLATRRGIPWPADDLPPVRVSHGKAAEYQARGAVHFHALLRLDGTTRDDPDAIVAPPSGITAADLEDAIRQAAARVSFRARPHPDSPHLDLDGWRIAWGDQLDVRTVADRGPGTITGPAVAGYLAKYSTKGTEESGHVSARIRTVDAFRLYADPYGTHTERLIHACWVIGRAKGQMCGKVTYHSLRHWSHMLGFGGHFLTKARRYSVTFASLRQARISYRRHQETGPDYLTPERQDDVDVQTTVVITSLSFAGTGWHTFGDALLANTAADQARKRRETAREALVDEHAGTAVIPRAA